MEQFKKIKQFGEWLEDDGAFKIRDYLVKPTGLGGNPVKGYKMNYTVFLYAGSKDGNDHWLSIRSGLSLDEAMIYVEERLGLRQKENKQSMENGFKDRIKEILKDTKLNENKTQKLNLEYGKVIQAMNEARLDEIARMADLLNELGLTNLDSNAIYDIINNRLEV